MADPQSDSYIAVLKASYDYEPQSEDEIAIKENQLLLLLERVDQDWWKVKVKPDTQDTDSPAGLVPAAYVEQAEHTSTVKVLYDYEAVSASELTVKEDDVLFVFETDQDWLLVQSREHDKAGYVPGNYVEPLGDDEPSTAAVPASRIVVPDSPPRPVSTYVDPEERVASAKVTADDIKTWSVTEIDKKGKKKKGTLGVGNGAVFFASEADKNPVQKWQTSDITDVVSEKAKHVRIEIAGPSPNVLHFHVGSKEIADEILEKLLSSRSLSSAPPVAESTSSVPAHATPAPLPSTPKKAIVHFSPASPVIIPPREGSEYSDENEEKEEPTRSSTDIDGAFALALYDFSADGDDELSVAEGEQLTVLEKDGDAWWKCRNSKGAEGVVPAAYLELQNAPGSSSRTDADDRAAQEAAERQRVEEERRRREDELAQKARQKADMDRRAKEAAAAAKAEKKRQKTISEVASQRTSPPPASRTPASPSKSNESRPSAENSRPSPDKTRIWHDRSGQFRVEAAFLGFSNGKVRLHKVNGVIVEVPSEKMSIEDMRYIEKAMNKKRSSTRRISDDDVPLAIVHPNASVPSPKTAVPPVKKTPKIDWFDFFLSSGCDIDDCTRYAASFERDKIDEAILPDITESTMRSLGLREGDIIRVMKAIEKRKPNENLQKPSSHVDEQIRRDQELAEKLQAQENGGTASNTPAKSSAPPNLFAGPGGVLKNPRRGRPQPSKSLPPSNVDLKSITAASDQIQRTSSPQAISPSIPRPPSVSVPPPRSSSAAPTASGFDNDAWTNRPSSTKPTAIAPRAPSAPPPTAASSATMNTAAVTTVAPPTEVPAIDTTTTPQSAPPSASLAKATESDIFDQLARLSELRKTSTPSNLQRASTASPTVITPSPGVMGIGSSPIPMGQIQMQPTGVIPQPSPQPIQQSYNGPRGPIAPVPANQGLLQPLIPTQTGFNNFIPTRANNTLPPFQAQMSTPSFLTSQPTGVPSPRPLLSQPTGFLSNQPLMSQPTGFGLGVPSIQQPGNGFAQVQSQPTGFNPAMNQSPFGQGSFSATSPPPLPATNSGSANPANVFAQMKSGTFATENESSASQPSAKYDPFRPNAVAPQITGWNQPYNYTGYR